MDSDTRKILAFQLGDEQYGIDLLAVQEIRGYDNVARIANAPDFIKGVLNLRGVISPVIDMHLRFNTGPAAYDALTVAIILSVSGKVVGMVVDAVSDVIALSPVQVKPAPDMGSSFDWSFITGLATAEDRLITPLDVSSLLCCTEMSLFEEVSA